MRELNPVIRGVINYYCKFWTYYTHDYEQAIKEMGEVGEEALHFCIDQMASAEVLPTPEFIRTLDVGTSVKIKYLSD